MTGTSAAPVMSRQVCRTARCSVSGKSARSAIRSWRRCQGRAGEVARDLGPVGGEGRLGGRPGQEERDVHPAERVDLLLDDLQDVGAAWVHPQGPHGAAEQVGQADLPGHAVDQRTRADAHPEHVAAVEGAAPDVADRRVLQQRQRPGRVGQQLPVPFEAGLHLPVALGHLVGVGTRVGQLARPPGRPVGRLLPPGREPDGVLRDLLPQRGQTPHVLGLHAPAIIRGKETTAVLTTVSST